MAAKRVKRAKPKRVRRAKSNRAPYTTKDGSTQSLISSWVHCREGARLYLEGWRSPTTKESLAFGGLGHFLFEGLYEGIRANTMTNDPDCLDQFFNQRVMAWRKKTDGWASPAEAQTIELCVAKAATIFPGYCQHWSADFDPSIWRELEGVFDVKWRGHRLRGRIDGVREVKKKLWILETKTMGRVDGSLTDALSFDFQTQFYITAAEEALERPVEGAIYNVVRRPGHKLKAGESLPAYTARIAKEVEKAPDHFYKRFELTFAPLERRRFEQELEMKLREFSEWCTGGMHTYRNERACRGRWNCGWLPACSSGSMAGFARGGRLFEELED